MPWDLVHNHPACRPGEWAVVNRHADQQGRHSIEGCHPTRERAVAQQRALYANEPSGGRQAIHEVELMDIQRLVVPIQSKAVTDTGSGEIAGLAAVYGNVDLQDDLFEPGAFARSAEHWSREERARLPLLDWHGKSIDRIIGSVTQLKSLPEGLWFQARFTKDERGQRARQLARDGHLSGVSVGWLPVGQPQIKAVDGRPVQVISQARVHEISLTPIPANPLAQLTSVKSLGTLEAKASDTPWSNFSAADYTPQQWRRACLIDTGQGDPDSKDRYKLPVREPGGALNRGGVHAAAAALAGARGGVQAPADAKARAARALLRLYGELGEDPPDSLRRLAGQGAASLSFDMWADAMRKAVELSFGPAAKAAAAALLDAYDPTTDLTVDPDPEPDPDPDPVVSSGPADTDGTPQHTDAADAVDSPSPAGTPPAPSDENPHGYAEGILANLPGPPNAAPDTRSPQELADIARSLGDIDQIRAEIDTLLKGESST